MPPGHRLDGRAPAGSHRLPGPPGASTAPRRRGPDTSRKAGRGQRAGSTAFPARFLAFPAHPPGPCGIETATEIAEGRPRLSVALVARGELGARLSAGARGHLRQACDRLGITVVEHTEVEAARVLCADGSSLASDATVWTAGFAVGPVAAAGGLEVTENGRIVVDRTMRSVSHPNVYAVGDCAYAIGDNGRPLPMSCASAGYTGMRATAAIVGSLTDRKIANTRLEYLGNHISLGRRDGILQTVDDEGRPKPKYVGGRKAARIKADILRMSLWATSHPTFGLPRRKRRLAAAPHASAEKAVA